MKVRTNVVVITYNALNYTKATIESLFEKTNNNFNLTIVDNGSRLDTIDYLDRLQPERFCKKIVLIKNNKNIGVGRAYNQGQQVSFADGAEFTAFCNNDLYFSADWLIRLEDSMESDQNIAMLSPLRPSAKVWYDDTMSTRDLLMKLPETTSWKTELELYTKLSVKDFDKFANQICRANLGGEVETISFPDSLSTCVCITRNKIFKTIGHFADPIFTNYGGEDIDMSWTTMSIGYSCAVDHGVYIHHFRGKSLRSNNMKREELLRLSNKLLYAKWKNVIQDHIKENRLRGVDIVNQINDERRGRYWLLFELNQYENFLGDPVYV